MKKDLRQKEGKGGKKTPLVFFSFSLLHLHALTVAVFFVFFFCILYKFFPEMPMIDVRIKCKREERFEARRNPRILYPGRFVSHSLVILARSWKFACSRVIAKVNDGGTVQPRTPAGARRKRVARRDGARPELLIAPKHAGIGFGTHHGRLGAAELRAFLPKVPSSRDPRRGLGSRLGSL